MPDLFQSLFAATLDDDRGRVDELLDRHPGLAKSGVSEKSRCDPRIPHWFYAGDTILHVAAAGYRVEIARRLLAAGADVASAMSRRWSQPLHYASDGSLEDPSWDQGRQVSMIRLLLKAERAPRPRTRTGRPRSTARCAPDVRLR